MRCYRGQSQLAFTDGAVAFAYGRLGLALDKNEDWLDLLTAEGLKAIRLDRPEATWLLKVLSCGSEPDSASIFAHLVELESFEELLEDHMLLELQYGGRPADDDDDETFEATREKELDEIYAYYHSLLGKQDSAGPLGRFALACAFGWAVTSGGTMEDMLALLVRLGMVPADNT